MATLILKDELFLDELHIMYHVMM